MLILSLIPHNIMLYADTNDTVLLSTNADIPEGDSSVCVFVVANNDVIAEYDESVLIIVSPVNPLDVVNQNTSFLIMDNDGLYIKINIHP